MTERSMAKTGCTVELLEVPRNMAETKMAPMTFSTSPWAVLQDSCSPSAPQCVSPQTETGLPLEQCSLY